MIINPLTIYLGQIFEGLRVLFLLAIALAIFTEFIHWLVVLTVDNDGIRKWKHNKKLSVGMAIVILIGAIGIITVPQKKIYYGMVAATYITTDNLGVLKQEGKELVDYLFEKLDGKEND